MNRGQRPLRVGIISANWGAQSHLPAWRLQGEAAEVVAICTSRPATAEAAAARYGIARPFSGYEAMCADPDIDIVDVGTNPLLREKMVAAALAGGKHVVNQVPFAASVEGAERLEAQRLAAGATGMVAASVVGLPHVAHLRELIEQGAIGDVFQVHCHWQMSYFLPAIPGFPYVWFGQEGLGVSVTRNQGSHLLHLLRHLFGPVDALTARMATQLKRWELADGQVVTPETDDTLHALLRFASGAMGIMTTSWTAVDSPGFTLDVFGSRGRLRLTALRYPGALTAQLYFAEPSHGMEPAGRLLDLPERFLMVGDRQADPAAAEEPIAGEQLPSMARLFHAFIAAIRDGGEPLASFTRALEVQRMVAALYDASAGGRWIERAW